jgi:hypothetical protein
MQHLSPPPNAEIGTAAIPKIAVIVPAYGVADLLPEALDSLLAQDFTAWEAMVIDDGAPDDVAGAVEPYLADPRIRFIATVNRGVSAARNHAIELSQAPLVALLDGDDLLRPNYLSRMVEAMDADPDATLVTCNANIFGAVPPGSLVVPSGVTVAQTANALDVLNGSFNIYIGSTIRRDDWRKIGGFDTAMTHAEDLDFWVRLLLLGGHARYLDAILGDYRIRRNSASTNSIGLIKGRMRLLTKVIEAHTGTPEADFAAERLIHEAKEAELADAIATIVAGDTKKGLPAIRQQRAALKGPIWAFSFALWRIFPQLAPHMLAWRARRHVHSVAPRGAPGPSSPKST